MSQACCLGPILPPRKCRKHLRVQLLVIGLIAAIVFITYHLNQAINEMIPNKRHSRTKVHRESQVEYTDRHGIRVIVGHYRKEDTPSVNYTSEQLNANNYQPVEGAGAMGAPVYLKPHQQIQSKKLWDLNQFDVVVSDMISVDRNLSDVRSPECQALQYNIRDLPSTSVIIVFHNEAWSTLIRTVHSVINTSPPSLLEEIILVDDASDRAYLKEELDKEVTKLSVKTKVIRSSGRIGLIQARLLGAKEAKGEVLTFLDAHCECTKGWLEPLINRIKESPTTVVCPVIDIINDKSFQYTKSFSLHWGGFNWELHFRWFTMGSHEISKMKLNSTAPFSSPVMAGGLFSIRRDYFWSSGSYDEKMDIWGGENLEMSFRIWQCGGEIQICPCSRVGHIFRRASPYTFPREGGVGGVLHANLARLALVWLDQYQHFFFKVNNHAKKAAELQNVDERLKLKKKCKSFDWYLDNVWPQNFLPRPGKFFGKIRSVIDKTCLEKPARKPLSQSSQPVGPALLAECVDNFHAPQLFAAHKDLYIMGDESVCLDSPTWSDSDPGVRFMSCSEADRQKWIIRSISSDLEVQNTQSVDPKSSEYVEIVHLKSNKCLSVSRGGTSDTLILESCSGTKNQTWQTLPVSWNNS